MASYSEDMVGNVPVLMVMLSDLLGMCTVWVIRSASKNTSTYLHKSALLGVLQLS